MHVIITYVYELKVPSESMVEFVLFPFWLVSPKDKNKDIEITETSKVSISLKKHCVRALCNGILKNLITTDIHYSHCYLLCTLSLLGRSSCGCVKIQTATQTPNLGRSTVKVIVTGKVKYDAIVFSESQKHGKL